MTPLEFLMMPVCLCACVPYVPMCITWCRVVLFQRGCLDVFILKGMPDVGLFTHLIIGHDGTGSQPGVLVVVARNCWRLRCVCMTGREA